MSNLRLVKKSSENNIMRYISAFLNSSGVESKNTKKTYERAIREFFLYTRKKELEDLTEFDLNFNLLDFEQYQSYLLRRYKRASVNLKITAVKQLFEKLKSYDLQVNQNFLKVKSIKNYDTEHYGSLSIDEIGMIVDFLRTERKGFEKQMLVKLAFSTAFRKDSLLNLSWSDFKVFDDFVLVNCIGKGNKQDVKKITNNLYKDLLNLQSESEKVFSLSSSAVQRMMDKINKNLKFENENITFHSFKKASIEEVARQSGNDLKLMQRHGNHSSVTTTLNAYLKNKDVEDLIVVDSEVQKIDNSYILKLTQLEILDIINSLNSKEQMLFKKIAKDKNLI